jgi:hypothetical protein
MPPRGQRIVQQDGLESRLDRRAVQSLGAHRGMRIECTHDGVDQLPIEVRASTPLLLPLMVATFGGEQC